MTNNQKDFLEDHVEEIRQERLYEEAMRDMECVVAQKHIKNCLRCQKRKRLLSSYC